MRTKSETPADIGHNSGEVSLAAAGQLNAFVERVERIESEIKDRQEDRKEIYAEARSSGFDVKTIKKLVAERKMDAAARQEQEALLETYRNALGAFAESPLGAAAMDRARSRAP